MSLPCDSRARMASFEEVMRRAASPFSVYLRHPETGCRYQDDSQQSMVIHQYHGLGCVQSTVSSYEDSIGTVFKLLSFPCSSTPMTISERVKSKKKIRDTKEYESYILRGEMIYDCILL